MEPRRRAGGSNSPTGFRPGTYQEPEISLSQPIPRFHSGQGIFERFVGRKDVLERSLELPFMTLGSPSLSVLCSYLVGMNVEKVRFRGGIRQVLNTLVVG